MTLKRTELAKNKMVKATHAVRIAGVPDRFGAGSGADDKKEQRKRDQAAGIVPFACKLPMVLITHLHDRAKADDVSMNELVAELLNAALEKPKAKATKKAAAE